MIVDTIQQFSLKRPQVCRMASESHSTRPMLKKKQCQSLQIAQKNLSKRSSLLLKKTSFFRYSSSEENQSQQSHNSNKNEYSGQAKGIWNRKEDLLLISLFKDSGADWEAISNQLQNKTSFEAKHRFHILMREIVDNINNTLREKEEKQINFKAMKAAIEATNFNLNDASVKKNYSSLIRDELFKLIYNYLTSNQELYNNYQEKSIQTIHSILLTIRKNRRKKQSSKASTQISMKGDIQNQQLQQGYLSDSSSIFEEPKKDLGKINTMKNYEVTFAEEEINSDCQPEISNGVIVEESQQGIRDLLRDSGVLQVEQCMISEKNEDCSQQNSLQSGSQNLNNQSYQHFFEEGELQRDCYWKKSATQINNGD